jgi:hypothetical protein
VHASGLETAPLNWQHFNPDWQSPSTQHDAVAPPLPGTHDFDPLVSVPLVCAAQALQ